MDYPETDLKALAPLIDPAAWNEGGLDRWRSARMAAACALAWLAGAHVREIARLRLADWRPDGVEAVRLNRGAPDREGKYAPRRARLIPILAPLRRAVEARLADMPGAPPESLLLAAKSPWVDDPRGWLDASAKEIAGMSGGAAPSLPDLSSRFRAYVDWMSPDPEVADWLAGRIDMQRVAEPPDLSALRKRLLEAHPAARMADIDAARRG